MLIALLEGPVYPARPADELGLTRQNVSNHLSCLRGCGLVVAVPEGRQTRYELSDQRLAHAIEDLVHVALTVDPDHHDAHEPAPAG
jgi:ArsR family transcriptional regulator, cadmium/lead-responsive transcriptional repressor